MKTMTIEKFIDGQMETSFNVPIWAIQLAWKSLPNVMWDALAEEKWNVQDILQAVQEGKPYERTLAVCEGGVDKQVVFTFPGNE